MYGVEAQKVGRLGDFSDALQQAAEQKFRGEHADGLKAIQAGHAQRLKAAEEKAKAEAAAAALAVMEAGHSQQIDETLNKDIKHGRCLIFTNNFEFWDVT